MNIIINENNNFVILNNNEYNNNSKIIQWQYFSNVILVNGATLRVWRAGTLKWIC